MGFIECFFMPGRVREFNAIQAAGIAAALGFDAGLRPARECDGECAACYRECLCGNAGSSALHARESCCAGGDTGGVPEMPEDESGWGEVLLGVWRRALIVNSKLLP